MKSNINHIYWFAPYNISGPSTRYRGFLPLKYLSKNNITNDFVFPERSIKGVLRFIRIFTTALFFREKNSIIVIQKVCSNRFYANLLKLLVVFQSKWTQFDIDDAEYVRQDTKSLHFFLKKCSIISVGSEELMIYCRTFNANVYILTSPVTEHNIVKKERNEIMNIGWVGDFGNGNKISKDFSHKTSLYKILFPVLKLIDKPIKLTLIGVKNKSDIPEIHNYFKNSNNININILENLEWKNDNWVYDEIVKLDIGVSPMINHLFNRSKSAFKAKQYLSVGIPTIASNVGENDKFVINNKNGIICNNNIDFKKAIDKFLEMSHSNYFEFSNNAIAYKDEYSMKRYSEKLINMFENAIQHAL